MRVSQLIFLVMISLSLTGCGSFGKKLKAFLGGDSASESSKRQAMRKPSGSGTAYSQNKNMRADTGNRKYERMTADDFQNRARVASREGSLWSMEGQEAYLFAQNKMRMRGDILKVEIEGAPRDQLETKVQVINRLLDRLKEAKERKKIIAKARKAGRRAPKRKPAAKPQKQEELFNVESVPVRIVEKLTNGNYRVRGGQTFMIDQREYKVIVTGIVKAGDIDMDSVKSTELLDSKFDIVSPRREVSL